MTSDMQMTVAVSASNTMSELTSTNRLATKKIRSLYDAEFFALMHRVVDIVFECATSQDSGGILMGDFLMDDLRKSSQGNPFYNQTADGLFLELCYGSPSRLWTPWGRWEFSSFCAGNWEKILPSLLERFGATLYRQLLTDSKLYNGPVYALHRVDDILLPDPVEMDPRCFAFFRSEIDRSWLELMIKKTVFL